MDEQRWLQREVRVLYEITQAINSSLGQSEALNAILEHIVRDLGYRAATLRLFDEERRQLQLKAAYGLSEAYLDKGAFDIAQSGIDQLVITGQTATLADARHDPGFQYPQAAETEGLVGMLAVPLAVRDRVLGVLHLYTAEAHEFTPEEKAFIGAVANLGAQAVQRTQFFEAFRRIARQVNSSLALKDVLATLLLESVSELNVKAGSIRLLGPQRETLHLAVAYGLSQTYLQKGEVKVASSPIDQHVLAEGKTVAITDLEQESGFQYPEEAKREGIRSVLVLPLRAGDTVIGVMRLYSGQVRRLSAEETDFGAAVADLGAVAIENAKLHEALQQRLEGMKEETSGWYRFLGLS